MLNLVYNRDRKEHLADGIVITPMTLLKANYGREEGLATVAFILRLRSLQS
jgi:hypothetical protein